MKQTKAFRMLLFVACGSFCLGACQQKSADSETTQSHQEKIDAGQTFTVKEQSMTLTMNFPAVLRGRQDVAVYPQVEGKIIKVCVEEGQTVQRGQPLFVLDQVEYKATLTTAQANLQAVKAKEANAKLNYESNLQMRSAQIISDFVVKQSANEWQTARAEVRQAEAAVTNAANSLSYTVVKSPTSGVIGSLPYKLGALVSANMSAPLTYVSDNESMVAYYALDEQQLAALMLRYGGKEAAIRQMAAVKWQASDGSIYDFMGKVVTISGLLDQNTGTVSVRATFPNPKRMLVSGATGNVLMPVVMPHALVIPQTAVSELQDKMIVYKVVGGKAKMQTITVYPINEGKNYVVTSGLRAGDVIQSYGVNRNSL